MKNVWWVALVGMQMSISWAQVPLLQRAPEWLNWHADQSRCGGHFADVVDPRTAKQQGYRLQAQSVLLNGGHQVAKGQVKLSWAQGQLQAPQVRVDPAAAGGQRITVTGPMQYDALGHRIVAQHAVLAASGRQGVWQSVLYRLHLASGKTVWGGAKKLTVKDKNRWHLQQSTWTVCSAKHPLWHIKMGDLWVNQAQGIGRLHDGVLYVGAMPVFYWPYLSFPINHQRKTGWLVPMMQHGAYLGRSIQWPWYWNVAPQQDVQWVPWLSQYSGLGGQVKWRYLSHWGLSQVTLFALPHDRGFAQFKQENLLAYAGVPLRQAGLAHLSRAKARRWAWALQHTMVRAGQSLRVDWQVASDDDISRQFSDAFALDDAQFLPRALQWRIDGAHGSSQFSWTQWQVLHALLWQPVANPYEAKPRWHGHWFHALSSSMQLELNVDVARFARRPLLGAAVLPTGTRWIMAPTLHGFGALGVGRLEATFGLRGVLTAIRAPMAQKLQWVIPSVALSWRTFAWLPPSGTQRTQLGLRAYYAWVPYHDQMAMPHFDVGWLPQFYAQLFSLNRFSGLDWQGDTHHVAVGLSWQAYRRLTGQPMWTLALGQGWAFERHRLCLDAACTGDVWARQQASALQLLGRYAVGKTTAIQADLAWDWAGDSAWSGRVDGTWQWRENQKIQLGYAVLNYPDDAVFAASMWPDQNNAKVATLQLTSQWSPAWHSQIHGAWDFQRHQMSNAGVELTWKSCCAALQLGVVRAYNKTPDIGKFDFENRVYIKVSLSG